MNTDLAFAFVSALWLGILTSISPCPMATNIAAISFIGRRLDSPKAVVLSGLAYTLGRVVAYVVVGGVLVGALLLSDYVVSNALQKYMTMLLGPILIVVGMMLLELIRFRTTGSAMGEKVGQRVQSWGLLGALVLGIVFALSFCPISAALFFGSLIPLAVKHESGLLMPVLYGVGTALPVVVFAVLIGLGAGAVAKGFKSVSRFEYWARRVTGVIFIGLGIYFSLAYTIDLI